MTSPANDKIEVDREATTVILDKVSVENLRIETEMVEERKFENTIFAIGRIREIPSGRSVVSSRAPGRIVEVNATVGDFVRKGDVVAVMEARVYGDPPPRIELKAPQDGMVTDVHADLGEPVEPSENIFELSDRSRVWAAAKIPEVEAGQVSVGSRARIRIPALGGEGIEATMVRYGLSADADSAAVIGMFELDNAEGKIQPGMRAEFSIITSSRDFVMCVPLEAVQGDPTSRLVFVKDFELPYAYVRAPVVLGEKNDRYVEIVSGLFPGDEVVTRGAYALSFAGAGSGMSLKEALDAAHGHEHNEDGSEMTPEQRAAKEREKAIARGDASPEGGGAFGKYSIPFLIWAAVATVLFLVAVQWLMTMRRKLQSA